MLSSQLSIRFAGVALFGVSLVSDRSSLEKKKKKKKRNYPERIMWQALDT